MSLLLIVVGGILLMIEIGYTAKNYYRQSAGIICLMLGLFLINTKVSSKSESNTIEKTIKEEESSL